MRRERFDLVHSMTPKAGLLAMVAARVARVPVRLHTFTGQVWATRAGFLARRSSGLDTTIARAATFALADSHSQRSFLVSEGVVPASKIAVLANGSVSGVDAARFRPDADRRHRVRTSLGLATTDVVLLFLGRITRDKGVLDLARAFAILAERRSTSTSWWSDLTSNACRRRSANCAAATRCGCTRATTRMHPKTSWPLRTSSACRVIEKASAPSSSRRLRPACPPSHHAFTVSWTRSSTGAPGYCMSRPTSRASSISSGG